LPVLLAKSLTLSLHSLSGIFEWEITPINMICPEA
jgi:hypothetical protein